MLEVKDNFLSLENLPSHPDDLPPNGSTKVCSSDSPSVVIGPQDHITVLFQNDSSLKMFVELNQTSHYYFLLSLCGCFMLLKSMIQK